VENLLLASERPPLVCVVVPFLSSLARGLAARGLALRTFAAFAFGFPLPSASLFVVAPV